MLRGPRHIAVFPGIPACLLLFPAGATGAEELFGKVVRVADGDTLTVLVSRKQIKVRLTEIDAPERGLACVIQASAGKMRHNADCVTLESPEERA